MVAVGKEKSACLVASAESETTPTPGNPRLSFLRKECILIFENALAARIPILGVFTDDIVNAPVALQLIAGKKVVPWPVVKSAQNNLAYQVYYTDDMEAVTVDAYKKLSDSDRQLVVINPEKTSPLIFDAGVLPTPDKMLQDYLEEFVEGTSMSPLMGVLKGLSLKSASEAVQLTMARTGGLELQEVRRTRTLLGGAVQGIHSVDTEMDFYQQPQELSKWLTTNELYFLNPKTPQKLMPRGLMLAGPPGVGKSMAAMAVANHFKVPLFRLDISTALNKYIGQSEANIARGLGLAEREGPCVLLLDEVEKLFSGNDDQGVTQRILSQLLWWLAEHRSKVLTFMTTNKLENIPPELYRPGRIDRVIHLEKLRVAEARLFASRVFTSIVGSPPGMSQLSTLRRALTPDEPPHGGPWKSPSEVAEITYDLIKSNNWLLFDISESA